MNEEKKFEVVKFVEGKLEMDINVSPSEDTIWLSLDEMSLLFERDRSVIGKHIRSIYSEEELDEYTTRAKNARHLSDGRIYQVDIYNLDVVIAVGYRVNSKRGTLFRKWANKVLKEYLLKGYVINENRVTVSNENYIELKNEVVDINNRLLKIEDKVLSNDYLEDKIFYNGEFYDAYALIQNIFEKANDEIIIIDNYINRSILDRLVVKKERVMIHIYTSHNSKLLLNDINAFNKQYGNMNIEYTNKVHDRYIIIDKKRLFHLGHSIKDIGSKVSSISELDNRLIYHLINMLK